MVGKWGWGGGEVGVGWATAQGGPEPGCYGAREVSGPLSGVQHDLPGTPKDTGATALVSMNQFLGVAAFAKPAHRDR